MAKSKARKARRSMAAAKKKKTAKRKPSKRAKKPRTSKKSRKKAKKAKASKKARRPSKTGGKTGNKAPKKRPKPKASKKKSRLLSAKKAARTADRSLYVIKFIQGGSQKQLRGQWKKILGWSHLVPEPKKVRIYCEGICTEAQLKERSRAFRRAAGEASLAGAVGHLLKRGAGLEITEDFLLFRIAGSLLRLGGRIKNLPDVRTAFQIQRDLRSAFDDLNEERYRIIAKRIDASLGRGESAVLYIGAEHLIEPQLPSTIAVETMEIVAWE